jgi:hypothetical protein
VSDIEAKKQGSGDELAKDADSTPQANSEEERLERSWDFLTDVTEKVSSLPQSEQDKIINIGRQLSAAGASYNHTVPSPDRRTRSPAKEAAKSAKKSASH